MNAAMRSHIEANATIGIGITRRTVGQMADDHVGSPRGTASEMAHGTGIRSRHSGRFRN
jgi:hypothetical protein